LGLELIGGGLCGGLRARLGLKCCGVRVCLPIGGVVCLGLGGLRGGLRSGVVVNIIVCLGLLICPADVPKCGLGLF
jgi:hypothetical protein